MVVKSLSLVFEYKIKESYNLIGPFYKILAFNFMQNTFDTLAYLNFSVIFAYNNFYSLRKYICITV
ncbi:hypothetical protein Clocl_0032 [Acetivibrio clariflavus DSM 19732]|uniref:Uncharacterized protein n=1 Tax=Acetivibrio clariflavus (strain DSM 19732 / NBRC 101661 / EBR45) TaxID=720554 RepID=G8LYS2_ACECE|nr:hypothetical protein Clocl_0032 [Acetivibrio clariflavus DSM 19732]